MSSSPPRVGRPREIPFPQVPITTLDNGLRVLTVQDRRIPRISVRMVTRAGYADCAENTALVPLGLELIKMGTANRSASEIADQLDQLAIQYDTDTHKEHSFIYMSVLENHFETGMEILSDMLQNPALDAEELERIRVRWRNHLVAQRSQPQFLANERIFKTIYGNHPYSHTTVERDHLEDADADGVRHKFEELFLPNTTFLLVAGDIDPKSAVDAANRHFGQWRKGDRAAQAHEDLPPLKRRVCLVHRPNSVQSHVMLAGRLFARGHPDSRRYDVANQVLGGGGSARLFLNLREEKGLTYGVRSSTREFRQDGLAFISTDVRTDRTAEALQEIFLEVDNLRKRPPEHGELSRSQSELLGGYAREMETADAVGMMELSRRIYGLSREYYSQYVQDVLSVTSEDVREMAARYLNPADFLIGVVADRERVESELAQFGSVEVFDSDGQPL